MPYSRELFEKRSTTAIITRHAECCVTPQLPAYLLAGVHICHIGQVLTEVSRELCEFRMAVAVAYRSACRTCVSPRAARPPHVLTLYCPCSSACRRAARAPHYVWIIRLLYNRRTLQVPNVTGATAMSLSIPK